MKYSYMSDMVKSAKLVGYNLITVGEKRVLKGTTCPNCGSNKMLPFTNGNKVVEKCICGFALIYESRQGESK